MKEKPNTDTSEIYYEKIDDIFTLLNEASNSHSKETARKQLNYFKALTYHLAMGNLLNPLLSYEFIKANKIPIELECVFAKVTHYFISNGYIYEKEKTPNALTNSDYINYAYKIPSSHIKFFVASILACPRKGLKKPYISNFFKRVEMYLEGISEEDNKLLEIIFGKTIFQHLEKIYHTYTSSEKELLIMIDSISPMLNCFVFSDSHMLEDTKDFEKYLSIFQNNIQHFLQKSGSTSSKMLYEGSLTFDPDDRLFYQQLQLHYDATLNEINTNFENHLNVNKKENAKYFYAIKDITEFDAFIAQQQDKIKDFEETVIETLNKHYAAPPHGTIDYLYKLGEISYIYMNYCYKRDYSPLLIHDEIKKLQLTLNNIAEIIRFASNDNPEKLSAEKTEQLQSFSLDVITVLLNYHKETMYKMHVELLKKYPTYSVKHCNLRQIADKTADSYKNEE